MQLRDPEAAEMLARMSPAWDARLFPAPMEEAPAGRRTFNRQPKPPPPSAAAKRAVWSGAKRKLSGLQHRGRHRFPTLDYRAWAAELAAFCTVPRTMAEMVKRFGLTGECIGKRLQVARTNRCWPPAPLRERWVYTAPGKRGLVVERVG